MTSPDERLRFLDSIRGLAAFTVLLSHIFLCFLFNQSPVLHKIASHIVFFNGKLAVNVFFVLSGMSLSIAYLYNKDQHVALYNLKRMIAHRFFRLTLPIAATSIIIAAMINAGAMLNLDIENRFSCQWIKFFYGIKEVSISQWFVFSFYDSIVNHGTDAYWLSKSLNPILWTMPIEFLGSMLVFLAILALKNAKRKWISYIVLIIYFIYIKSYMFHFMLGIIASHIYVCAYEWERERVMCWGGGGGMPGFNNHITTTPLIGILIIVSIFWPTGIITSGFVGFAIILLCSLNGAVIKFLEKPPFIFLGKICFTLYLVHIPIITSLTSFIVIRFDGLSTGAVICVAGLLTVGVSIVVAWLFMFVEKEMIRLYKKILI